MTRARSICLIRCGDRYAYFDASFGVPALRFSTSRALAYAFHSRADAESVRNRFVMGKDWQIEELDPKPLSASSARSAVKLPAAGVGVRP